MALSLFDLDNTLLAGDSDYLWGEYLAAIGATDSVQQRRENDRHYAAYQAGDLDIQAFLAFALAPLARFPAAQLYAWRRDFVTEEIVPRIPTAARRLVEQHQQRGDHCVVITATNRFVSEPVAALFGIQDLLATELEMENGHYTGRIVGTPTFQEGKVERLRHWLGAQQCELRGASFYSDSINDLPLLEQVAYPVAVDPDPRLDQIARHRHWPRLTLRGATSPQALPTIGND